MVCRNGWTTTSPPIIQKPTSNASVFIKYYQSRTVIISCLKYYFIQYHTFIYVIYCFFISKCFSEAAQPKSPPSWEARRSLLRLSRRLYLQFQPYLLRTRTRWWRALLAFLLSLFFRFSKPLIFILFLWTTTDEHLH